MPSTYLQNPPTDPGKSSRPVDVNLRVNILNIDRIDTVNMMFALTMEVNVEWKDHRLKFKNLRAGLGQNQLTEEVCNERCSIFCNGLQFLQVSKWKLYKTARKRGIYAEIKKQNQEQALNKVPTNVQHFADLGVYKQLKKKTHLAKEAIFPHLPPGSAPDSPAEVRKVI